MAGPTRYSNDPYIVDQSDPNVIIERRPRPVIKPPVYVPQIVTALPQPCADCAANHSGSGFEQKIKENPVLFLIGALVVGYLLAKK